MTSAELKPVAHIHCDYDFLLPLNRGQRIVAFKRFLRSDDVENCFTQMSCFDRLGRLIGSGDMECHVERERVAQSGPHKFVVCHGPFWPELIVYNSRLKFLRGVDCKNLSAICCNSKFVFGLWDDDDDEDSDDSEEQDGQYSCRRIQVHHLDTLDKAFCLRVPAEYRIERIMADERHMVAISRPSDELEPRQWFMNIFDLKAIAKNNENLTAHRKFFLVERHIELAIESMLLSNVFLLNGWLAVPGENREIVWFDKSGKRSETSTKLNNISDMPTIYPSGSSLLFALEEDKLLLKR